MSQKHSGSGDNVGGDKNQQTTNNLSGSQFGGGAAGGDYTGNITNVTNVYHTPPSNQPQRDKNQQELIKYIGEIVDRLLSQSLRNQVYITLDKIEDFSKVTAPMQLKFAKQEAQPLPPETTIIQVYDRPDINGRLLILGDPGSGKSTNLYKLAQELVIRAKDDINHPIPVLFNLSSWTSNYTTIKDWLIDELNIIGFSKKLAKQYLDEELIIPCLDGLDELQSDRQTACVEAINTFLQPRNWKNPVIVCSRRQEFDLLQTRIDLNGAVILQPLTDAQIQTYLQETKATHIQELIAKDEDWRDLAKTPLFLDIMVLTNKTLSLPINQDLTSKKAKLSSLWEAYLNLMLDADFWIDQYKNKIKNSPQNRQKTLNSYLKKYVRNPSQTRYYLTWLAQKLTKKRLTVFVIEKLQPNDLANREQELIYERIFGLIFGLSGGLIFGLIFGLSGGLIFGLIFGLSGGLIFEQIYRKNNMIDIIYIAEQQIQWSWLNLAVGVILGVILGVIGGVFWGVIFGVAGWMGGFVIGGVFFGEGNRGGINGVDLSALFESLIGEKMIEQIMGQIRVYGLIFGLIYGLIFGLIDGLIHGLIHGLRGDGVESGVKSKPHQGIQASINNTLLIWGMVLILGVLLYEGLVLISPWLNQIHESLFIILRGALLFSVFIIPLHFCSGKPVLQHFSLRLVLTFNGYSPWHYARFLDYCTEQLLLQRIGGGYRFIHRLLQEHLLETKN